MKRQRQGSGHGNDGRLCVGSQDSGGTGGSTSSGHGRGARQRRTAAADLTDGARLGEAQGRNAGHWRGLTTGAAQRKCERCGMKMSGGAPFYKTVWQLKGFQKPKSRRNKFRNYCEIYACTNFHPAEKHKI